jgi:hypothetical protein
MLRRKKKGKKKCEDIFSYIRFYKSGRENKNIQGKWGENIESQIRDLFGGKNLIMQTYVVQRIFFSKLMCVVY